MLSNTFRRALFATIIALSATFLAGGVFASSAGASAAYDAQELRFLTLINQYRQENGVGPLVLSDDLSASSEHHNEDMSRYGFFAHETVESSRYPAGSLPWDRMAAEGYDYNTYKGENLAGGYASAEEAFRAWKASPPHNKDMLDGHYKVVGISRLYVPGSPLGWYWTTDFGGYVDPSSHGPKEGSTTPSPKPENAVKNGTFANRKGWEQRTKDGAKLILRGRFARLGDYANGADDLRQKVLVGHGAKLSYSLKVSSREKSRYKDFLKVRLLGARGGGAKPVVLKRYTGEDAGGWRREEVDLSRYAGRTLYLDFRAKTDGRRNTTFYLDNVKVTA